MSNKPIFAAFEPTTKETLFRVLDRIQELQARQDELTDCEHAATLLVEEMTGKTDIKIEAAIEELKEYVIRYVLERQAEETLPGMTFSPNGAVSASPTKARSLSA